MRIPIAPEGLPIIKWTWFIFLMSLFTLSETVITIFTLLLVFVLSFFRDPLRQIQRDPSKVYAAADGKITQINDVEIDGKKYFQISYIFICFQLSC